MGKMFWFCCLGMVAAAAGVYLASHHDQQSTMQTVCRVGQSATQQISGAALAMAGARDWVGEHCEAAPPQIIDVSQPRCSTEPCEMEPPVHTSVVVPACMEECAVEPMPPCKDEESEPIDVMPQVEEEDGCVAEFWMNLFRDLMKEKENEQQDAKPAVEESESVPQGEPADCQEDKDYHHRYPGCPYMGGCPGSRSSCTPAVVPEVKQDGDVEEQETPEEIGMPREVPPEGLHPDVDTMEFRPSDGPAAQFGPVFGFFLGFFR